MLICGVRSSFYKYRGVKKLKKRIVAWILVFGLIVPAGNMAPSAMDVDAKSKREYIEGQIILAVRKEKSQMSLKSITTNILKTENSWEQYGITNARLLQEYETKRADCSEQHTREKETSETIQFYVGNYSTENDIWDVIEKVEQEENVVKAEPNYICHSFGQEGKGTLGSEGLTNQWYLDSIGAINAWENLEENEKTPGEGVVVAVVDTGVSLAHEGLKNNIWKNEIEAQGEEGVDDDQNGYVDDIFGVNMVNTFTNMTDSDGHGTMMSGIIGLASTDAEAVGVAYGAKIMPVKVSKDGDFGTDMAVEGICYAVENGADIINMSFGTYYDSYLLQTAIRAASEKCMLVAAAGNESTPTENDKYMDMEAGDVYPASYSNVVGVMAMDSQDKLASYSNWDASPGEGGEYEIVAPGTAIYSSTLNNGYDTTTGTSPATAMVSGALAIWRSLYPDEEEYPAAVLQQLFLSTQKHTITYCPTSERELTYRKLNIMDMVEYAMNEEIVCDKQPPVIKDKTGELFQAGKAVTFEAEVTDNVSVQSVKVYFRQCGEQKWEQALMEKQQGAVETNQYAFTFLSDNENPGDMEYYFEACDGALYTLLGSEGLPQKRLLYRADVKELEIKQIPEQNYTGTALTPDVEVYDGGKRLVNGIDYTLSYASNTEIGTAVVTIAGTGNYIGTLPVYFFIVSKKPEADATPDPAMTPAPSVTPEPGENTTVSPAVPTDVPSVTQNPLKGKKVILRRTYREKRKKAKLQWKLDGYKVKKWYVYCSYNKKKCYKLMKKTNRSSIIVPCKKRKKYYRIVAVVVLNKKQFKSKRSEAKACIRI